ncbi:sensor domain-containing diguanylate cyclase [Pseudidiomarina donghaiensis]|uniref:diguanylate cyclase n=2 Tax=Pseudidiomarina donghaiensis TaxID=519452 RepID=A0A432XLC0_9GAMM|nr:sensor domain-containing diguanylate cyclase [Pseudidiomarina donghaiensis]SFV21338.1 diguanylate cyclase (GGDEF) domain-containing protein [Pseudidiomarina donghaiensis]
MVEAMLGKLAAEQTTATDDGFGLMISVISMQLINSTPDQSQAHIEHALALLGRGGSKDRCYVFEFSPDQNEMSNTYEWVNDGISPHKDELQNIPAHVMPYFFERMREDGQIVVADARKLPDSTGGFRDELLRENIRSMMAVGMYMEGKLIGFVGCDLVNRQTTWHERDIRQMRLVADMIANTLARHHAEARLQETEAQLLEANAKLAQLAREDSLTGLINRRGLDECLEQELRRAVRAQHPLTLIMVDVDFFKKLNDEHGHLHGDEVLKSVARILATHFKRTGEYVARFGGDEFMIVCPQTELDELVRQAKKVLAKVRILKNKLTTPVTVSIGIASNTPKSGVTTDDLMRDVDVAVYFAKQCGRNRIEVNPKVPTQKQTG